MRPKSPNVYRMEMTTDYGRDVNVDGKAISICYRVMVSV